MKLVVVDSFLKFWIKDSVLCKEITLKKCSVIYGKGSIPIFHECKNFKVYDSFIKNPELVWRSTSEKLENMVLL